MCCSIVGFNFEDQSLAKKICNVMMHREPDGEATIQIIERIDNPRYYDLIYEYYKLTGIPTLINTIFNNHEEPIVCSPQDAFKCLFRNNIDYLVIEDWVVFRAIK